MEARVNIPFRRGAAILALTALAGGGLNSAATVVPGMMGWMH